MGLNNKLQLEGRRFGKWLVLKKVSKKGASQTKWLCRCDCGREYEVFGNLLSNGRSTKCKECVKQPKHPVIDGRKRCSRCKINKKEKEFKLHKSGRFNSQCNYCVSEKAKNYYQNNAEVIKKKSRDWQLANPEQVRERHKLYRQQHKNEIATKNKVWREENKEELKIKKHISYLKDKESGRHQERGREWRERNREKCRAAVRKHNSKPKNREKRKAYNKWYKETFPEKYKASRKQWADKHPEKVRCITRNRRARIKGLGGDGITATQVIELKARFGDRCLWCEKHESDVGLLEVDHVIPVSKNGQHDLSNIQMLCRKCNSKKKTRILDFRWKLDVETASGF